MISLYLWYPRSSLLQVPGDIKDTVHVEPAVTVRLDNIERMVGKEMKAGQAAPQWPALQVNGVPESGGTKPRLGVKQNSILVLVAGLGSEVGAPVLKDQLRRQS